MRWNPDPWILAALVGVTAAYAYGLRVLWRGRPGRGVAAWRAAAFGGGVAAVFVALVSPVDSASHLLLSAHMFQHLLLILIAAPLFVVGAPATPMMLCLPVRWRRNVRRWATAKPLRVTGRALTSPPTAWLVAFVVLWSWHVPAFYQAALAHPLVHVLEHATFLSASILFWWVALPSDGHRRLARGADVLYVVSAAMQGGALGALFTFAASPIYPFYLAQAPALQSLGLTPLKDQQLAGLIMWIPFGLVYLATAAALFVAWLKNVERHMGLATVAVTVVATASLLLLGRSFGAAQAQAPSPAPLTSASPSSGPQAQGGRMLYLRDCAWCHGIQGEGTGRGPSLVGVGSASSDFMLSTGRMPITRFEEQPRRRAALYNPAEIQELNAFIASLGPGPSIPSIDLGAGDLAEGAELYEENCAACHSSTGIGATLTSGLQAPSLGHSTPAQIAEAVRIGGAGLRSGNMPRFDVDALSDQQLDSVTRYVLYLQRPEDRGGLSIGHLGPVAEGFVAWFGAFLACVLLIRWIGKSSA